MIEAGFVEALNGSIDRLNAGDSVANCLLRYPQYAAQLAPLLQAGRLVQRAQADADEATRARERQRQRFEQALNQPVSARRSASPGALVGLVASIVLILALFTGGAALAAESSLPGDALYSVKLWTETLRLSLTNDDAGVQAAFAARRLEEARQLVRLRRQAEMTFTGTVDTVIVDGLVIDGLEVAVEDAQIAAGSRVEVDVISTEQGRLIARQIRLLEASPDVPLPSNTVEPTPALRSTQRPALTDAPTATPMRPLSASPTGEATVTRLRSAEPTALASRSAANAACQQPTRWVRYIIQPGDTLSALAEGSRGMVDQIVAANCLEDARYIVAGQVIFLPQRPLQTRTMPTRTDARSTPDAPSTQIDRPAPETQNTPENPREGR